MQIFPTRMGNVIKWRHSHWLMALVGGGGGWGRSMYSAFPWNCSVSYLSFVYRRSLWAELNGGKNSLHWKVNMLPLFSIMTLWYLLEGAKEATRLLEEAMKIMLIAFIILRAPSNIATPNCNLVSWIPLHQINLRRTFNAEEKESKFFTAYQAK